MATTPGNTTPLGFRTPATTAQANGAQQITDLADDVDGYLSANVLAPPVAVISNSGTQTVTANTVTLVLMDTIIMDEGAINPALPTDRIIIERAGVYRASAMLAWTSVSSGASGYRGALLYLNAGALILGGDYRDAFNGAPVMHSVTSRAFRAIAGDYVDLRAIHSDSTSRSVTATNGAPWLSLQWIRP